MQTMNCLGWPGIEYALVATRKIEHDRSYADAGQVGSCVSLMRAHVSKTQTRVGGFFVFAVADFPSGVGVETGRGRFLQFPRRMEKCD